MVCREQTVLDLFKSLLKSKKMHFAQDLCFIDSPTHSGSQYINCKDPFLSSLSPNVNLDVQQFVNLFISLFGEKSLFCVILDQIFPSTGLVSFGLFQRWIVSRFQIYLLSGSRKFGRGETTRRCSSMRSSLWAVTTMSAGSKHRKLPRVRIILF